MLKRIRMWMVRALILSLGCVAISFGDERLQKIRNVNGASGSAETAQYRVPGIGDNSGLIMPAVVTHDRYRTLLRTIDVPDDQAAYGDFCNFGYWTGTEYAGQTGLPKGYWVYLAPKWYIFKDLATDPMPTRGPRPWGPEQATGKPDTWPKSGDIQTAWASQTPDGQPEWLELKYAETIRPTAVLVYETFNPGAVNRITGYTEQGKEVELWSGVDPTPVGKEKGISVIPVHPDFDLKRIRISLDSPKVTGWNEIDAVGLLDESSVTHWATEATASSTYADQISPSAIERNALYITQPVPTAAR